MKYFFIFSSLLLSTVYTLRLNSRINTNSFIRSPFLLSSTSLDDNNMERKELWKTISRLEKEAVEILSSSQGDNAKTEEAFKLLSKSIKLKKSDPFLQLSEAYNLANDNTNQQECDRLLAAMKNTGLPPHIAEIVSRRVESSSMQNIVGINEDVGKPEEVDPGSTFSDTVTEKVRVKVNSYFDTEKSDPANGRYMFYYKVGIYNEGPEPVQVVGRMWEIEKCEGEKEVIRGPGIMNSQPIISPGDVFTYQSTCPLKLFPPKGKRILASMSGAYTMCKGNMGQHNFSAKVGKFNLILPETALSTSR